MKIVLVLFLLNVQSSYLRGLEQKATKEKFDTIQFVITSEGAWRVKTYAVDEDVHVWRMSATTEGIVDLAYRNTQKHYGDVISQAYTIETLDGIEGVRRELKKRDLTDHLETSKPGLLFWTPPGTQYRTKSTPQH
jgi:hypothetical protein